MLSEYDDSKLNDNLTHIFIAVDEQIKSNLCKYRKHPTIEHSLAVLLEEVEELKQEVFRKETRRSAGAIYQELKDVAAVAVRAILDLDLQQKFMRETNESF